MCRRRDDAEERDEPRPGLLGDRPVHDDGDECYHDDNEPNYDDDDTTADNVNQRDSAHASTDVGQRLYLPLLDQYHVGTQYPVCTAVYLTHVSLGPAESITQNRMWISSAIFPQLTASSAVAVIMVLPFPPQNCPFASLCTGIWTPSNTRPLLAVHV